jgi:hypothetical protein
MSVDFKLAQPVPRLGTRDAHLSHGTRKHTTRSTPQRFVPIGSKAEPMRQ